MENLEHEVKYENLNVNQLIKNKRQFDYEVIDAYVAEYYNGFKVKEVGKTHRSGTTFIYEKIYGEEEVKKYKRILTELIKKYNSQYEEQITLEDFCKKI